MCRVRRALRTMQRSPEALLRAVRVRRCSSSTGTTSGTERIGTPGSGCCSRLRGRGPYPAQEIYPGQEIGGFRLPFDDGTVARSVLVSAKRQLNGR